MQRVLFVCVQEEKTQNIEPNETKKSIFNLFLSPTWHLRIFQFSLKIDRL